MMIKNIGIIFADEMEFVPFEKYADENAGGKGSLRNMETAFFTVSDGDRAFEVTGVKCGIGKVNAAMAAAFLISDKNVCAVLNAGLSGAVSSLRREDFVAGSTYTECDFDLTAIGYPLGEKPGQEFVYSADEALLSLALQSGGIKQGALGTGDIFLADKVKKELYREKFGICAFDMESAAIAGVCHRCSVPMLSLRKISDDADDAACGDYREMNERAEDSLTMLLASLLNRMLSENSFWEEK